MPDLALDQKTKYNEGCNALRHYSLCVMNMRTVTIAQGLVLLSGTAYLINQKAFQYSFSLAIFGLLFTGVLYGLQKSYWEHFEKILEAVVILEISSDENSTAEGPWSAYKENRKTLFDRPLWGLWVRHGPFMLLLMALLGIAVYDAAKLL